MSKQRFDDVYIDVDYAYEYYRQMMEEEKKVSKAAFLKMIGMSPQTASNYQNGISSLKPLQYLQKIEEVTGLEKGKLIKILE